MRDNSFVAVILILALLYIISPIDLIPPHPELSSCDLFLALLSFRGGAHK